MKQEHPKTHNYEILKTYTVDEIKAHGDVEFFMDEEVTDRKIKLRRAHVYSELGGECIETGCELSGYHYAVGKDAGGGIHLDLYAYDHDGDLVMITVDHITPKSKGGKNHVSNYQPMCKPHNEMKSNVHNFERKFIDLVDIYKSDRELVTQNYSLYKRKFTQKEYDNMKKEGNSIVKSYVDDFVVGKDYMILDKRGEGAMMSDHPSETMTNQHFINHAYGDVIVFGLGMGMIIFPLLKDKNIKTITIVEKDMGLISLIGDFISTHDVHNKVTIVHGDAFEYHNKLGTGKNRAQFDTIYFDIWIRVEKEHINEMEQLHSLYSKFKRGDVSYLTSWLYDIKDDILAKELLP